MAKTVGVSLSERIITGLVVDHKLTGGLHRFPENEEHDDALVEVPADGLVRAICEQILTAAEGAKDIAAVGVARPGVIKNGVVEEAPNLPQLKGARVREMLQAELKGREIDASVTVLNDADGC